MKKFLALAFGVALLGCTQPASPETTEEATVPAVEVEMMDEGAMMPEGAPMEETAAPAAEGMMEETAQ